MTRSSRTWTCPSVVSSVLLITAITAHFVACQSLLKDSLLSYAGRSSSTLTRCNINCSQEALRSVCGTDGRTYGSKCELQKVNCQGHSVQMKHKGKCKEKFRCWEERDQAEKAAQGPTENLFVPQCNEDGSYTKVQCHAATGYCWCATRSGHPISGTSVKNRRPKCRTRAGDSNRNRNKQKCKRPDRFNKHLVQLFTEEYKRITILPRTVTTMDTVMDSPEIRAVNWKFTELDKNGNQILESSELKIFKRMMKKISSLRDCAKNFQMNCDDDHNRRISRKEWNNCLGNKEQEGTEGKGHTRHPLYPDEEEVPRWKPETSTAAVDRLGLNDWKMPEEETPNCFTERQMAIDQQKNSRDAIYIPECDTDDQYAQVQCYKSRGYCWCVDRDSGKPIPNTSVQNAQPDCEKMIRTHRPIKGCPEKNRKKFITDFVDVLSKEMGPALNQSSSTTAVSKPNQDHSVVDAIARWKFDRLDTNANRVLDKKEWKNLRKDMKKKKSIWKCGRNFIKFCDYDNDKNITYDEWSECFGIFKERNNNNNSNRRQMGQNPLDKYLKND